MYLVIVIIATLLFRFKGKRSWLKSLGLGLASGITWMVAFYFFWAIAFVILG